MATTERPLRRDAERNRQRILETAGELFAERGLGVSLDEIARHAGVGVGTVYRRFPDKEQLIDALFEDRLNYIRETASAGLELEDPWQGLAFFIERSLEAQVADRALKELLLSTSSAHARIERGRAQIEPIVEAILERARAAGAVREDLALSDLLMLQHAVGEAAAYTHEVAPEAWRRIMCIALDGLRPDRRRPSPMPAPPLDEAQVLCAMREWGELRRRR